MLEAERRVEDALVWSQLDEESEDERRQPISACLRFRGPFGLLDIQGSSAARRVVRAHARQGIMTREPVQSIERRTQRSHICIVGGAAEGRYFQLHSRSTGQE